MNDVLNFDDGLKHLKINGDENRVIAVNPTDMGMAARYAEILPELEKLSEKYQNADSDIPFEETVKIMSELDKKAREFIDYIIGTPVSDTVFGTANCLSAAGGQSVAENFLTAYMNYATPVVKAEFEQSKKRISKYTEQIKK